MATMMKAAVFVEPGRIVLDDKPVPDVGPNDALVRITTTTICGTDVHILKGEYPVEKGLIVGHEPVGVIEKLGRNVEGYAEGQRVIAGAICPSGYSNACLDGLHAQDGQSAAHGRRKVDGKRGCLGRLGKRCTPARQDTERAPIDPCEQDLPGPPWSGDAADAVDGWSKPLTQPGLRPSPGALAGHGLDQSGFGAGQLGEPGALAVHRGVGERQDREARDRDRRRHHQGGEDGQAVSLGPRAGLPARSHSLTPARADGVRPGPSAHFHK